MIPNADFDRLMGSLPQQTTGELDELIRNVLDKFNSISINISDIDSKHTKGGQDGRHVKGNP